MASKQERSVLLVMSNPVEGREEEYHEWYENTHIGEVLWVPGIVSGQRFELVAEKGQPETRRFLVLYEVEGDPQAVFDALNAARDERQQSRAFEWRTASMQMFRAVGAYQTEAHPLKEAD